MKKIELLCILFTLLLVSGCKRQISDTIDDTPINKDGSIAFRASNIVTKGTPQIDLTPYDKVNVAVYSHSDKYATGKTIYRQIALEKDGSGKPIKWNYEPHMFWPEGQELSFMAYAIESKLSYATASNQSGVFVKDNGNTNAPTIEYVVPTKVEEQPDLLVTAMLDHKKASNITLLMEHALSCVSFCATGPDDMRVKSISLKNVYCKASLALDDPSIQWTDHTNKDITIFEAGVDPDKPLDENPSNGNYLMTATGYLMMIPQTLTDAIIDVQYWEGQPGTEKTISYTLPTTIAWEPGRKYIYKFGEDMEEVVVYYEKYADDSYGIHTNTNPNITPSLDDNKAIVEAGYGVLTKNRLVNDKPTIRLGANAPIGTKKISSVSGGYNLYAVSQTSIQNSAVFTLPSTTEPADIYFDGNDVSCGKIIPHFAKGVYDVAPGNNTYAIRTAQQMRNISVLTTTSTNLSPMDNPSFGKIFTQERSLDFSKQDIGGGTLNGAVVDDIFAGTYNSDLKKSISNVTISAASVSSVGLFANNNRMINSVILKSSSITGASQVGGIAGQNMAGATINKAQIIGTENTPTGQVRILGQTQVGGIAGWNNGTITGNADTDPATALTVASISGWVAITASSDQAGAITGCNQNLGVVETVLVYGVFVRSSTSMDFVSSQITVQGSHTVGGIVGDNWGNIVGTVTTAGGTNKVTNMPDVGGVVTVRATGRDGNNYSNAGGIAGRNALTGKLNAVNVRTGRTPALTIEGVADNVGGIVGDNLGTLGAESTKTFISVRGNVNIKGANNVGGIAGYNNSTLAVLQNCFVYDFHSRDVTQYYAPQITATGDCAGGIVGNNNGGKEITGCSVFSMSRDVKLSITSSQNNAGGIVGNSNTGADGGVAVPTTISACSVVGPIEVKATGLNAGGCAGTSNSGNITIKDFWVGSRDGNNVIKNAITNLNLVVNPTGGITEPYGTPLITGGGQIGGVVGLNAGVIDGVKLSDNVIIGRGEIAVGDGSNWVGGIVGGNMASYDGNQALIKNCQITNEPGRIVVIQGSRNIGGIVGLNNGVVDGCTVSGSSEAARLVISGLGTMGGIVGQNGGHAEIKDIATGKDIHSGNDYTVVKNCKVTGYVTTKGVTNGGWWLTATEVGGIAGINGPNRNTVSNIDNCSVKGAAAAGNILITVDGSTGGIVGTNSGTIRKCDVSNATIKSTSPKNDVNSPEPYAGGIVGITIATSVAFNNPTGTYRSDINDCRVYPNVSIESNWYGFTTERAGVFAGYINSTSATNITFGGATVNAVSDSGVTANTVGAGTANLWGYMSTSNTTVTVNCSIGPLSPR